MMDGKITMMHLINEDVRRLYYRTLVLCPTFRIGFVPVYHSTAPSVHAYCLRCNSCRLLKPLAIHLHLERIELSLEIFLHGNLPESTLGALHITGHESCRILC